jgi:hypothetical protein
MRDYPTLYLRYKLKKRNITFIAVLHFPFHSTVGFSTCPTHNPKNIGGRKQNALNRQR